jgi:RNA polymerase sigma-70 factor (ECF subfamily)
MATGQKTGSSSYKDARFTTTHWSVVLSAKTPSSPDYQRALNRLCETYWFPIYAFLRRQGWNRDLAEDYTQGFFTSLMEKQGLRLVDSEHGRFRSYLLGALKHFLADEHDRDCAQKRGGDREIIPLDFKDAETRYSCEPAHDLSPEKLFQKSWALMLLDRALKRLRKEAIKAKSERLFDQLKTYLTGDCGSVPYGVTAQKLGMTEGAVRTAVHRFRASYRNLLRDEIARTVSSQSEVEEELRDLFDAFTF